MNSLNTTKNKNLGYYFVIQVIVPASKKVKVSIKKMIDVIKDTSTIILKKM